MNLAPIIMFVYNRPWHTEQSLDALMQNDLSNQSTLYIYCDGPKESATKEERHNVEKVRALIKKKEWCRQVNIVEREINLGLANSVIKGVAEVIEKHKRVIVLEDDIVTGRYFLNFMNEGLSVYNEEKSVFGISGYQYPSSKQIKDTTYFLPIMSSWGYATWLDRWQQIEFNGKKLLDIVNEQQIGLQLDFGDIKYYQMLQHQIEGKNDSWAVRFYVSMFLKQGVFLYPNTNLIYNIGLDGSGVHCKNSDSKFLRELSASNKLVQVKKIPNEVKSKLVNYFREGVTIKKERAFKNKILKAISPEIKAFIRRQLKIGHKFQN